MPQLIPGDWGGGRAGAKFDPHRHDLHETKESLKRPLEGTGFWPPSVCSYVSEGASACFLIPISSQ